MNIRKIKRKCDVRGCKNIDVFSISKVREHGKTVIIYKDCLEEAYKAVQDYTPEKKQKAPTTPPPSIFYHPENVKPVKEQTFTTDFVKPQDEPKNKNINTDTDEFTTESKRKKRDS